MDMMLAGFEDASSESVKKQERAVRRCASGNSYAGAVLRGLAAVTLVSGAECRELAATAMRGLHPQHAVGVQYHTVLTCMVGVALAAGVVAGVLKVLSGSDSDTWAQLFKSEEQGCTILYQSSKTRQVGCVHC